MNPLEHRKGLACCAGNTELFDQLVIFGTVVAGLKEFVHAASDLKVNFLSRNGFAQIVRRQSGCRNHLDRLNSHSGFEFYFV